MPNPETAANLTDKLRASLDAGGLRDPWPYFCSLVGRSAAHEQRCPDMGQIEDKSQLINSSLTQRGPNQDRDRRIVEKLNRLNQASIVDARRRVAQMEATIANFERTIRELEGWIQAEQSRPGVHADSTLASS